MRGCVQLVSLRRRQKQQRGVLILGQDLGATAHSGARGEGGGTRWGTSQLAGPGVTSQVVSPGVCGY